MQERQQTVRKSYQFEGKGLHTGKVSRMVINPAPIGYGIKFRRTDMGCDAIVPALSEYVSNTQRSTTLSKDGVTVATVEHVLSALTGLGVDNALIDIDNIEVPILDGSASYYVEAISTDGLEEQDAPREYIRLDREVEYMDPQTGSWVKISPAEEPSYEITVDFNSRVLGVQTSSWDGSEDYASGIGCCRTFVFFHELEYLFNNNLIKGGDVDNALVIVEHPASAEQIAHLSELFGKPGLSCAENGYLDNVELRFDNECARHKLLDLIGDMRLCGGFLKAKVTAVKPGHTINSKVSRMIRDMLADRSE